MQICRFSKKITNKEFIHDAFYSFKKLKVITPKLVLHIQLNKHIHIQIHSVVLKKKKKANYF